MGKKRHADPRTPTSANVLAASSRSNFQPLTEYDDMFVVMTCAHFVHYITPAITIDC